jgi:uracil-DNA glycosylase
VRQYKSGTHMTKWKNFTNYMLKYINENCENLVFLLWGNHAMKYENLIDTEKHYVLKSGHPSPLNRTNPFLGNDHFIDCNKLLKDPINW